MADKSRMGAAETSDIFRFGGNVPLARVTGVSRFGRKGLRSRSQCLTEFSNCQHVSDSKSAAVTAASILTVDITV